MESEIYIRFPDQSKSFTYGVEFGRILEQIEQGKLTVSNHGFPVRLENKELLIATCNRYGYIPSFGKTMFDEWVEFLGIKSQSNDC